MNDTHMPPGHARYQLTTRDLILKLQHTVDKLKICHDKLPVPYQQLTYRSQMTDALRGKTVGDLYDGYLILEQAVNNWISIIEDHQDRRPTGGFR